jgi:ATP-dependent RNA helicase
MAEGIDRKADERMEFTTSKDVTVAPTFQDSKFSASSHTARGEADLNV